MNTCRNVVKTVELKKVAIPFDFGIGTENSFMEFSLKRSRVAEYYNIPQHCEISAHWYYFIETKQIHKIEVGGKFERVCLNSTVETIPSAAFVKRATEKIDGENIAAFEQAVENFIIKNGLDY